jgi:hypothetical protein
VSKPEHERMLRNNFYVIIVGSAFMRQVEKPGSVEEVRGRLAELAKTLRGALDEGPSD